MPSRTLRIFTVLSVLLLLGLAFVQFYWFRQAYQMEDRDFDQRVTSSLRIVCRRLIVFNDRPNNPPIKPVERVTSNYYTVQVNDRIDPSALEVFLRQEFARNDLKANFEYAIYDCEQSQIRYGGFVCHTANCDSTMALKYSFPQVNRQNYYFGVFFPEKRKYLLNQLNIWAVSTGAVLLVIVFFSYALWVIFRQKRLSELQSDFVNNLTHEFKTPLSTILISTDVLTRPDQPRERLASYATIIRKEALRLKQQVDTVLQTAQQSSGATSLHPESVSIREAVQDLLERSAERIRETQAVVATDLPEEDLTLHADRMHFSNILFNLLDNALKYASGQPDIRISARAENQKLLIGFEDRGQGIPPEYQSRVFDRFFRVPTGGVHNVKGFGLGLYYVRTMTEAMGGSVRVESRPEGGSRFILQFPFNQKKNA